VMAFGMATTATVLESSLQRQGQFQHVEMDDANTFSDAFSVKVLNMIDKIGFLDSGVIRSEVCLWFFLYFFIREM